MLDIASLNLAIGGDRRKAPSKRQLLALEVPLIDMVDNWFTKLLLFYVRTTHNLAAARS